MSDSAAKLHDEVDHLRAMPMRRAVTIAIASGFVGMIVVVAGLWWLAGTPSVHWGGTLSAGTVIGVLQLVFGLVVLPAGIVALVVNYRKQRVAEAAHGLAEIAERRSQAAHRLIDQSAARDGVNHFEERFARGAELLGHASPAVRLAGVHWLAALADAWPDGRRRCADLLCGYARLPYDPEEGKEGRAERGVRIAILGVISQRMYKNAAQPWHDLHINLQDALISGTFQLNGWQVSNTVSFDGATFDKGSRLYFSEVSFGERGELRFAESRVDGADIRIIETDVTDQRVAFNHATVTNDGSIVFHTCSISGELSLQGLRIESGHLGFMCVTTAPGTQIDLSKAQINSESDAHFSFFDTNFRGATLNLQDAILRGADLNFTWCQLAGAVVNLEEAHLAQGTRVYFPRGTLRSSDGATPPEVIFTRARLDAGSRIEVEGKDLRCRLRFSSLGFQGGQLDLSAATFADSKTVTGLPAVLPKEVSMPPGWPGTQP
ncbi:hypothetical protein R8Z50_11055 [Longispora sp. K20-0274]|uniref:pentapeptide repeat-containing protein n=1 Tax=Longispora sp. K20-0274 TaxID=3088255 RepID=UPI00399BD672